jgi:2-polyprenyl-6-methoxyphenol hydroxylase-like FAD-dependent oxidoreductase
MADIERILIVGGGIAGLTVATALHRRGFKPELIERSAAWPAIEAGIFLPANGVRVLQALGLGGCMAMEDALVSADVLRTAGSVEAALAAYVLRRRSRASWVQTQSRAAAQAWALPAAARNAALRERGDQMFRDRHRPLIPEP